MIQQWENTFFVITLTLLSALRGCYFLNGTIDCNKLMLDKVDSYNGSMAVRPPYRLADIEGVPRSLCSYNCLLRSLECAGVLYNDKQSSSTLLMCHLGQKLTSSSITEDGWGYWQMTRVKCPFVSLFECDDRGILVGHRSILM